MSCVVYFNPEIFALNNNKKVYFQYHIGIHTNYESIFNNKKRLKNISMKLHSYASKAITDLFPNCKERFLLVSPKIKMEGILINYINENEIDAYYFTLKKDSFIRSDLYSENDSKMIRIFNIIIDLDEENSLCFVIPSKKPSEEHNLLYSCILGDINYLHNYAIYIPTLIN